MRHLIAVSIFALATSAAMAADAPLVVSEPAAGVDWSGFYAGIFAGASLQDAQLPGYESYYYGDYYNYYSDSTPTAFGGELGVAAGYNAQFGAFVLGVEGDIAWADNTVTSDSYEGYGTAALNWIGTLRAKAGVAVAEGAMLYATAGLAAADIDYSICYDETCSSTYDYGVNGVRYGLTAGVGAEAMVTDNLSIDAKLLYTKLESTQTREAYYDYYTATFGSDIVSARVGLIWHLN